MEYVIAAIVIFVVVVFYMAKKENKSDKNTNLPVCNKNTHSNNNILTINNASPYPSRNHLLDINIPYDWYSRNKSFLEPMRKKYGFLLEQWADSRNIDTSPQTQLNNLSEFVNFMDESLRICKQKGRYFEAWFYQYLADPNYIEKRRSDLQNLTENIEDLQAKFDKRKKELVNLDARIVQALKENDGILQSEFSKLFDASVRNDVRGKLYFMEKSGALQRIKSGKSYILHYNK